jgi:hypothetical protein
MTPISPERPPADAMLATMNGNGSAPQATMPPAPQQAAPFTVQARQASTMEPFPRQEVTATEDEGWAERWRHALSAHRAWLAAVPVILVNAVAFAGQLAFLRAHLLWPLAGQVLVAVTLESVAVYLAWQAHLALIADDSALRLRLAAYGFAAVIGVMNYSHWMAPGWRPTFAAVTFGLMSVSSPWLWSVHSRRVSRDALKAKGLIEAHAVRLGGTRWAWHPWRSARVMWHATWQGENDPVKAIALVSASRTAEPARDKKPAPRADDEEPVAAPARDTKPALRRPARKRDPKPVAADRVRDVIRGNPGLGKDEVAQRAGVSVRTVERVMGVAGGTTAA